MVARRGRDIALMIGDGATPETFIAVSGVRAKSLSLDAEPIDATSAAGPGGWRRLIGAGAKAAAVSAEGPFRDLPVDAAIREAFFLQRRTTWRVLVPGFGALEGPFVVDRLDYAGDEAGEATFSFSLASAGPITFTPH